MKTICIILPEYPEKTEAAKQHFAEQGVENVEYFTGIDGTVAGVQTDHPYMLDRPDGGEIFRIGHRPTAIFISHYMLWSALMLMEGEHFFILESDAEFRPGWKEPFDLAMQSVPPDFDWLFVGSCACKGKPAQPVANNVYEIKYPMCFHAYVIAKKAIPILLAKHRKIWAPIDIATTMESFPELKVYAVQPRLVDQRNSGIGD